MFERRGWGWGRGRSSTRVLIGDSFSRAIRRGFESREEVVKEEHENAFRLNFHAWDHARGVSYAYLCGFLLLLIAFHDTSTVELVRSIFIFLTEVEVLFFEIGHEIEAFLWLEILWVWGIQFEGMRIREGEGDR